jgi:hypothetical protein
MSRPVKFPLGRIVATANLLTKVSEADIARALQRHQIGDWGDVCAEDRASNERALVNGTRLVSGLSDLRGDKFWIITEWNRS